MYKLHEWDVLIMQRRAWLV